MTPWQVLRAGGAVQAALGSRYSHGQGGPVSYSTAAAAAPDGSRSFCLSSEKLALQQLNGRLASYLQQVQCLEETNQRLEILIQQELDRKCPGELRELDRHLRSVSLLQEQIRERLSDQAEMKLQLLHAELIVHDLSMRYEKEQERHGSLEVELSNLRLLEEELQVHRLPELQMLLNDQTQQLMELQIQHQQDMQSAAAQMSGGVTVEMQPAPSLDLMQQLHHLRETDVTLLDSKQDDSWFNTQVSMLNSPEVTLDSPAGSEVILAELQELRATAAGLEQELTQLQALNAVLEASGLQQNESIVQELLVLQQRADGLCGDLDSVQQLTAQQVLDHQVLLDVTTRLEAEIEDYRRLLDGLSPRGFSDLHPNSAANLTSVCVTSSPSLLRRRDFTANQPVRMTEFQAVSSGHMQTIQHVPVVSPLTETVTTVQSVSKHLENPPVTSTEASNLNRLFQKSESQTAESPGEVKMMRESVTIRAARGRQSRFWVQDEGPDSQNSSPVTAQISRGLDKGPAVQAPARGVSTLPSDTPSLRSTEATLQTNEQTTVIETETTKTILHTGAETKQITHLITATTDASEQTAAGLKTETETVSSAQMSCDEGSIQAENQGPAQAEDQGPAQAKDQDPAQAEDQDPAQAEVQGPAQAASQAEDQDPAQAEVQGPAQAASQAEDQGPAQAEVQGPAQAASQAEDQGPAQAEDQDPAQAEDQDPAQAGSLSLQTPAEAPGEISAESNLICGNNLEGQEMRDEKEVEVENTSHVVNKTETIINYQAATAAGSQDEETETNIQTVITTTIICVEPEVKQTAAEVKTETETVSSAQMTSTEGATQAEDQDPVQVVDQDPVQVVDLDPVQVVDQDPVQVVDLDPVQVVDLGLQTPAEAAKDAEEVPVTASLIPGSDSDGTQGPRSDSTLMADDHTERQEQKDDKDAVEVESSSSVVHLDQITSQSNESSNEQIKVMEEDQTRSDSAAVSSGSSDDKAESNTEQSATALETTETTAAGLQDEETETNIQTVITKTIVCVEPEVKQEPQTETTDTSEQTAAEVKTETETVSSAQMTSTEGSTQAEDQDPAQAEDQDPAQAEDQDPVQVVDLGLQTPAEAVKDAEEVSVTASFVSGSSILRSEELQGKISGDLTLTDDNKTEKKEDKEVLEAQSSSHVVSLDQTAASSDASSSEQVKVMEEAPSGSDNATEGSIQLQNCDPAQVVSLSLETSPEAAGDAEKCAVTASIVSGSLNTEEAQDAVPCDPTLTDNNNTERQGEKKGGEEEVTLTICRSDQTIQLSEAADGEQIKDTEDEHKGSETTENGENLESKTAQSLTAKVPETQSIISAAVQEKTETRVSENTTAAAGSQENKTETNIQTVIPKPSVCAESGATNGPHPTKTEQTAAEVKQETEAQTASTEGSTQTKIQDPVQVVSLSLQPDPSKPTRADQTSASSDAFKSQQNTVLRGADVKPGPESITSNGRSPGQTSMSFSNTGTKESPSEVTSHAPATSQQETRRFSSRGGGEWLANGGSLGRKSGRTSLLGIEKDEGQSVAANPTTNTQETGRFGSSRSAEWIVYSGSLGRKSSLRRAWSEENQSGNMNPSTSLPEIRRFGSGGRGSLKTIFSLVGDDEHDASKEESPPVTLQKSSSTPEALGRFGSGGSGEWRVYGGSTGKSSSAGSTDKASSQKISQPSKRRGGEPRLGSTGSTGSTGSGIRLSSGSVAQHTNSAGSGGGLSSSSSGGRLGSSSASQRISTSRKFTSTGSGEWKPVYSSANARKSSVGSTGRSGGGGAISSQRAPSSGGRTIVNMGSGGWLSSSTAGVSSQGSGSKLSSSGGSDRISILAGAKISSSSGSGRTNITGGRVITSSDRPVRSTGSGAGGNKERISVCKMAALSISAAGRERNQGKQEQPQRPQQQQKGGASSSLLQRWLTAGVGIKSVHPDGHLE